MCWKRWGNYLDSRDPALTRTHTYPKYNNELWVQARAFSPPCLEGKSDKGKCGIRVTRASVA